MLRVRFAGSLASLLAAFAPAAADPALFPADRIDSVILSSAELDQISAQDNPASTGEFHAETANAARRPDSSNPDKSPCGNASWLGSAASFGDNWTAFRSLFAIGGTNNAGVHLVVAVYPDPQTAREAFARIAEGLKTCAAKTTVDAALPEAVRWRTSFFYAPGGVDSQTYAEARSVGNVVLQAEAESLFRDPGPAVTAIVDRMAQRVRRG
ncbi:sensor domain-containing protein [Segniliparus rugosus]|uniref:PknH-like extracellular domain-containing protein n=1 Tax=Segniliparus rugosus (strain ATCC BAA-974 / DSM 45345 / CCUG 50838 / CIP 108380 / JCM 13579 / CDC 945) TaxID=679197 RepID=U1LMD4_SEGRC|nr:sensor domain-containing protein [Segniliparus rugosus]ERG69131.1 hypothetical protein HMPREF9336_04275 [Segniliparus rugosus ATCC BAA-974]